MSKAKAKGNYTKTDWQRYSPVKWIGADQLESLAAIGCTYQEAADVLGVHRNTLHRDLQRVPQLRQAWDRGRSLSNMSIRRKRLEVAMAGDTRMLIYLSRVQLGEAAEVPEHDPALNIIQQLLDKIDGKSRTIPEANQQMKDITPVDHGPRGQPDSAPMELLLPPKKTNGSGNGHG